MLTGGYDKTLRLFQVCYFSRISTIITLLIRILSILQIDGKKNPKVQGIVFEDTPITKAWFSPDGKEVVIAGRKPWFYLFDVVSGKVSKVWFPAGEKKSDFFICCRSYTER